MILRFLAVFLVLSVSRGLTLQCDLNEFNKCLYKEQFAYLDSDSSLDRFGKLNCQFWPDSAAKCSECVKAYANYRQEKFCNGREFVEKKANDAENIYQQCKSNNRPAIDAADLKCIMQVPEEQRNQLQNNCEAFQTFVDCSVAERSKLPNDCGKDMAILAIEDLLGSVTSSEAWYPPPVTACPKFAEILMEHIVRLIKA